MIELPVDTIFALSSGQPPAAIAVVRISGPRARMAASALAGSLPKPRLASLRTLRDSNTDELLDRALVTFFPGPHSATGEDLIELHLHGGRAVVAGILAALAARGLRGAEPGEFTRRAFEHGRIDLAEAEGLADLLQAETESQRRAALSLAGGALSRQVEAWRGRVLAIAARIEAQLDFADEADVAEADLAETQEGGGWAGALDEMIGEIRAMLSQPIAERLRDGVKVVIAGPPNSGKSSLLNRLLGREAAIVSAVAGTTRDLIEAPAAIGGTPFLLVDTAGLRDSSDTVERIGVERAWDSVAGADLILWLGDPKEAPQRGRTIVIHSKSDLSPAPPGTGVDLAVSALTGENLEMLIRLLIRHASELLPGEGETSLNERHRRALRECVDHLGSARTVSDPLLAAEALRLGRMALDRVTGRTGVEDMLDNLFGRFCIGK